MADSKMDDNNGAKESHHRRYHQPWRKPDQGRAGDKDPAKVSRSVSAMALNEQEAESSSFPFLTRLMKGSSTQHDPDGPPTCYYWSTAGHCKYTAAECQYSHHDTGHIANPPSSDRQTVQAAQERPSSGGLALLSPAAFWRTKKSKTAAVSPQSATSQRSDKDSPKELPKNFNKPLTCYYWYTYGKCNKDDDECAYAHYDTGKYSNAPLRLEPGLPAIAGRNAEHALKELDKKRPSSAGSGEVARVQKKDSGSSSDEGLTMKPLSSHAANPKAASKNPKPTYVSTPLKQPRSYSETVAGSTTRKQPVSIPKPIQIKEPEHDDSRESTPSPPAAWLMNADHGSNIAKGPTHPPKPLRVVDPRRPGVNMGNAWAAKAELARQDAEMKERAIQGALRRGPEPPFDPYAPRTKYGAYSARPPRTSAELNKLLLSANAIGDSFDRQHNILMSSHSKLKAIRSAIVDHTVGVMDFASWLKARSGMVNGEFDENKAGGDAELVKEGTALGEATEKMVEVVKACDAAIEDIEECVVAGCLMLKDVGLNRLFEDQEGSTRTHF
ncbi:MAG: hypothetical protein M1819_004013 [Sarea resinae]|nr:MAG: hypothetical protein M1819_004013 [Sarea resinae]